MPSAIDPTKPADGVPAEKADQRANWAAAKAEIEALQAAGGGGGTPLFASVKDFGATGNGTTNDGPALQTAINTVRDAGGGMLFFPAGTYITAQKLILYDFIYLVGGGSQFTFIKRANGSNTAAVIETRNYAEVSVGNLAFDVVAGIGLVGLSIDGNDDNNTSGNGLHLGEAGGYFKDLHVMDQPGDGVICRADRRVNTNFPTDPRRESIWDDITIFGAGGVGIRWEGANDAIWKTGVIARCGLQAMIWTSGSNQLQYAHFYANGFNNTDGSYAARIGASALIGILEVRDNFYGGIEFTGSETTVDQLYLRDNGSSGTTADTHGVQISGGTCRFGKVVGFSQRTAERRIVNIDAGDCVIDDLNVRFNPQAATSGNYYGLVVGGPGARVSGRIHNYNSAAGAGTGGAAMWLTAGTRQNCDINLRVSSSNALLRKDGAAPGSRFTFFAGTSTPEFASGSSNPNWSGANETPATILRG